MRVIRSIPCISLALLMLALVQPSFAQVAISVSFGPPALPVYEQPLCPGDGYIWTPGYWAYDPAYGYYWVPGTWVLAPQPGFLWTPGWWGWSGAAFIFHQGYWGPHIGFYGGINYGFGYFGNGFQGGRWDNGHFFYNRAVTNVNVTNIHNVYNTTIVNNVTVNRVSYNGGAGGITARPTAEEQAYAQERHIPPVAAQTQHVQMARSNPQLRASVNQGRPPIAATARPAQFSGHGVIAAKQAGAPYHPVHASDLQPHAAPPPRNSGNAKVDQQYQQQQAKLIAKQNQEHQQLQQKQQQEDQRAEQQRVNAAQKQQMEQRHGQQTQQMEQRHAQEQRQVEKTQAPHETTQAPHEGGKPR